MIINELIAYRNCKLAAMLKLTDKNRYFLKHLGQGLLFLTIIVVAFIYGKDHISDEQLKWLHPISDNPKIVYTIFALSEVFFGIIPPEVFMIWGLQEGDIIIYIKIVALLFLISYAAGVLGYFLGKLADKSLIFRFIRIRFLGKYLDKFQKYGFFMLVVAATTPVPFSGICMLVGASRYPTNKFFIFASTRIVRFTLYAWIIWEANVLT